MMLQRALLGTSGGGIVGALYGVFGRCTGGSCAAEWNAAIPTVVGAAIGLFLVMSAREG